MRIVRIAAPLLALGLAVAACSGAAATPAPATPAPATPVPTTAAVASTAPSMAPSSSSGGGRYGGGDTPTPGGALTITLATTSLGKVLVDGNGMTLYAFTADSGGTSACSGGCASNWPPLIGTTPKLGAGLTASAFGSITRSDGTKQVTFHGMPLYDFSGDSSAGQTNGQGFGGKWYVVGSDGKLIK